MWLFAILALMWGGGFGGFGNAGFANAIGYQNLATQNDVQRGFDNQNTIGNQREILSAVTNGTAQSVAATNQVFHDLIGYVGDKYNELDRDVLMVNAGIPIKNSLGQPLLSNVVPYGRTYGRFVMGGATTTATDSYVILRTPCYA